MQCIFQRNWHSSVRKEEQNLLSEVTYCGTDREVCARLIIDPKTFIVEKALWEIYRTPERAGFRALDIPGMVGMEAYFGSGGNLRKALQPLQDSFAGELFAEAVRAIIQAETFLLNERGYTPESYEQYWIDFYKDTCCFFSNLDRVTLGWYEYIGYCTRSGSLFNRMKSQILTLHNNSYFLSGHFNDSFHGIAVGLELEKDTRRIKDARGSFLRAPDPVCKEAAIYMKQLEGKLLTGISKKDIAHLLGASNGCVHMIDLVFDGQETLTLSENLQEGNK
ncbi:MAG: DUF2889 domain-containing protein [Dethiobacteria bacterium]